MSTDGKRNAKRSDLLGDARRMRHQEPSMVLLRLIRLRIEELKDELVERRETGAAEIRGAIHELRSFLSSIENDPPSNERRDGAYA